MNTPRKAMATEYPWISGLPLEHLEVQMQDYLRWAEGHGMITPTGSLVKPGCRPALLLKPRAADQPKALPSAPAPAALPQIASQWLDGLSPSGMPIPWSGDAPF
jgi:hypothetical protein